MATWFRPPRTRPFLARAPKQSPSLVGCRHEPAAARLWVQFLSIDFFPQMYNRPTRDQTFVKIDNFYLFSKQSGKIVELL
jgi:hypothetical protein